MGKKKTNSIIRIQQAVRTNKLKFTSSLQDLARESIPGEWITEIIEYPATVPVGAEFELLQDVLASSDNVFYKPRRRREYRVDSSNLKKWQLFAENYTDWVGYSQINKLSNYTADLDFLFNDDKEIYND